MRISDWSSDVCSSDLEALSGQSSSWPEGLGKAGQTQYRLGTQLRRSNRRAETRRQTGGGNRTPTGEITEQRARGRPRQAEDADQAGKIARAHVGMTVTTAHTDRSILHENKNNKKPL